MSIDTSVAAVLADPVAQQLLQSQAPARLAYTWRDGTPRVVPIWFHHRDGQIVVASPPGAPKIAALETRPQVAITIDSEGFPPRALLLRGRATVDQVRGVAPEYAAASERYLGPEQGRAWAEQASAIFTTMHRVVVTPTWARILDFETRLPSALQRAMQPASA